MTSLVDVARAMEKEKDKEKGSMPLSHAGTTAASKPALSLVDVAKDHHQNATQPAKAVTLMDVARKTDAEQSKKEVAVSLQNLAADINEEERSKIDKAITKVAAEVKQENEKQRTAALKAAANEVRQEEVVEKSRPQKTAKVPDSSLQTTPPRPTPPVHVTEADDEDGYSSFEDDGAGKKKVANPSAHQKKPAKGKERDERELDNQSDEGSSGEPQKTTPSDSPQTKEFLRAVYRGDLRNIRDMMREYGVDANTADQHGWSALHWSASQGQTEILSCLLEDKSAQVNAVEHMSGWTALHVAVTRDNVTCVKKLLAASANVKIRDAYGDTVYDIVKALKGKRKERLLQLLEQHRHALG